MGRLEILYAAALALQGAMPPTGPVVTEQDARCTCYNETYGVRLVQTGDSQQLIVMNEDFTKVLHYASQGEAYAPANLSDEVLSELEECVLRATPFDVR